MTQAKTSEEITSETMAKALEKVITAKDLQKKWLPADKAVLIKDKENLKNSLISEILESVEKMINESRISTDIGIIIDEIKFREKLNSLKTKPKITQEDYIKQKND